MVAYMFPKDYLQLLRRTPGHSEDTTLRFSVRTLKAVHKRQAMVSMVSYTLNHHFVH